MKKNTNPKIKLAVMVYDPAMPPILVTEKEMYAIKYTFEKILNDHPDITHPDYTDEEVKMQVLRETINLKRKSLRTTRNNLSAGDCAGCF